jgi:hypothetical protein
MVSKPANSINANGGAGLVQFDGTSSFTEVTPGDYGVLISSSSGVPSWLANGTTGQVLTATTSGTPSWGAAPGGSVTFTGDSGTPFSSSAVTITGGTTGLTFAASSPDLTLGGTLVVANGGTGRATLTNHGILVGAATTAITQLATGSSGQILQSGGASADPVYSTATYPSTSGTAGNFLVSTGTNFTSQIPTAATNYNTSNAPTGTTSTTFVMMGLGTAWTITPKTYSSVMIHIDGSMTNNTTGDGIDINMSFGTGTAPINGAAATGTLVGKDRIWTALVGLLNNGVPFSLMAPISGLTPGTSYWFDLQVHAITGGTASVSNLNFTAQELMS